VVFKLQLWASGGNMGTGRYALGGAGTQTAGLGFGGYAPPPVSYSTLTEEYDGASWTSGGSMSNGRYILAGCGTQTAALGFGGTNDSSLFDYTEEYNGSSWTGGGPLNTARQGLAGAGTQTSALAFGGMNVQPVTLTSATEEYNGTNWATSPGQFKHSKIPFSRSRNTNSCFSFWWGHIAIT
jgi:hypothetical protein